MNTCSIAASTCDHDAMASMHSTANFSALALPERGGPAPILSEIDMAEPSGRSTRLFGHVSAPPTRAHKPLKDEPRRGRSGSRRIRSGSGGAFFGRRPFRFFLSARRARAALNRSSGAVSPPIRHPLALDAAQRGERRGPCR